MEINMPQMILLMTVAEAEAVTKTRGSSQIIIFNI
jgi:hypothetical protein